MIDHSVLEVYAPATIANLSCGFDMLGLCLDHQADVFTFKKADKNGIVITDIMGAVLSCNLQENVAGVAGMALWSALTEKPNFGIEVKINKKMAVGSGLGSSAASAAAMVFGLNQLFGNPFSTTELIFFAMQGEKLVSGQAHADNVAPALLGGITAVTSYEPLHVKKLPVPNDLFVVVIHPETQLKTSEARAVLPTTLSYKSNTQQMGFLTNFIAGLYESDADLIQKGLHDVLVEPYRKKLIPFFDELRAAATLSGSLGFGISGAGPSMFSVCFGSEKAENIKESLIKKSLELGLKAQCFSSKINKDGIQYKVI